MLPAVSAAYRQAGLRDAGVTAGRGDRWNPLDKARAALPKVPDAPSPAKREAAQATLAFGKLLDNWKRVAGSVVKPRTVGDAEYGFGTLKGFLGHDDAGRVTVA